jgi:hypothetical protein
MCPGMSRGLPEQAHFFIFIGSLGPKGGKGQIQGKIFARYFSRQAAAQIPVKLAFDIRPLTFPWRNLQVVPFFRQVNPVS